MLEMLNPSGADLFRFATTVLRVRGQLKRAMKQDPARARALSVELFCSPPESARRAPDLARLRADATRYFGWGATQWQAQEASLRSLLAQAVRTTIEHDGQAVQCYRWAPEAGTTGLTRDRPRGRVLLSHGWEGYAFNFARLIELARTQGWEVHAFDHLAHGASGGTLSGLPVMLHTLAAVAAHVRATAGELDALVGHSLGAAAASGLVTMRGLPVRRLALLASFYDTRKLSATWAQVHLLPEDIRAGLQAGLEGDSGITFDEFMPAALAARFNALPELGLLAMHDRADKVTAFRHSAELSQRVTHAQLLEVSQLGHIGMLADTSSMRAVVAFIGS